MSRTYTQTTITPVTTTTTTTTKTTTRTKLRLKSKNNVIEREIAIKDMASVADLISILTCLDQETKSMCRWLFDSAEKEIKAFNSDDPCAKVFFLSAMLIIKQILLRQTGTVRVKIRDAKIVFPKSFILSKPHNPSTFYSSCVLSTALSSWETSSTKEERTRLETSFPWLAFSTPRPYYEARPHQLPSDEELMR